jgi:hypothetical protein
MSATEQKESSTTVDTARDLFGSELNVVNIGLEIFYNALKLQDIHAVDANWNPPPKLDKDTQEILDKIL